MVDYKDKVNEFDQSLVNDLGDFYARFDVHDFDVENNSIEEVLQNRMTVGLCLYPILV